MLSRSDNPTLRQQTQTPLLTSVRTVEIWHWILDPLYSAEGVKKYAPATYLEAPRIERMSF